MSYTINKSDGSALVPGGLSDGTINTTATSLTLIGKDYAGYGQFLNENFVYLLENFAGIGTPANPIPGQLWFDRHNNILKVYTGNSWKISTGATTSPYSVPPSDTSNQGGDLWFDTTNSQLKVWSGTTWVTIGPVATSATGNSGAVPAVFLDSSGSPHVVVQIIIFGIVYAIFSKDTFTSSVGGFPNVVAGVNFNTSVSPSWGISSISSLSATSLTAGSIVTNGITTSGTTVIAPSTITTSTLTASTLVTTSTITVGSSTVGTSSVTTPTLNATAINVSGTLVPTANLGVNLGSSSTWFNNIYGSALIASTVNIGASILPLSNVAVNIGSTSNWFNNIYGTAVHAQYADLAERFEADNTYEPGTVVEMGGPAEITKVTAELSDNVFGVISTNAAYLMNSRAGTNATHPPIAMSGRVPVKVIGRVKKGDRLVSAGNGCARAGSKAEITPWNVIGRSLVDKLDNESGIIEAIVKINS